MKIKVLDSKGKQEKNEDGSPSTVYLADARKIVAGGHHVLVTQKKKHGEKTRNVTVAIRKKSKADYIKDFKAFKKK